MLRRMRLFLPLAIWLASASVRAQTPELRGPSPPPNTAPAAEAVYRRGMADFQAGRVQVACQEFAESYRLEALPGVLFTLATCEARVGRVASSAAHFQDFIQLVSRLPPDQRALQREREQVAQAERAQLLPRVPYLMVSPDAPLPPGSSVELDGTPLGPTLLDRELPVDPEPHRLSITLPGGKKKEQTVELEAGEHKRVTLVVPELDSAVATPDLPRAEHSTNLRPWLWASGAFTFAALATGTVAGSLALHEKHEVDHSCVGNQCTPHGKQAADRGQREALVSTAAFGASVLGLTAMLVLYLRQRKTGKDVSQLRGVTITRQGVAFGGVF
jgi:hypothetical protein